MALIGLGLIAISFCFFAYTAVRKQWPRYFDGSISTRAIEHDEKRKQNHTLTVADEKATLKPTVDDKNERQKTPKVQAKDMVAIGSVPLFNLHEAEQQDLAPNATSQPTTQAKLSPMPMSSSKSNTSMAPPPRLSSTSLMPPPSVKASALRPLPRLSGSLAPPPSAASTLRGPPKMSQNAGFSTPASTSTLPPSKRPSRKVLLDPGHSPLDWANLIRSPPSRTFLRGEGVPPQLIKVTPSQLKKQNGRKGADAWGTYQGKVYNLSPYLKFHPGGVGELMRGAGKVGEAERLFIEIHPWVNWDGMLSECLVGILVSEDRTSAEDLEAMD